MQANNFLMSRLGEAFERNKSAGNFMNRVGHYRNYFQRVDDVIGLMRKELKELDKLIMEKDLLDEQSQVILGSHSRKIHEEMERFETDLTGQKNLFKNYLDKTKE